MSAICPIENKDDSIQRVPAIVASGNSSGTFSGPSRGVAYIDGKYGYASGSTTLYGSLTSDLAQMLAKPLPPKEIKVLSLYGWSWLGYISMVTIIGPYFVWKNFIKSIAKNPDDLKTVFTPGVSFMCFIMLLFGCIPFLGFPFWAIMKSIMVNRLDYPRRYQLWDDACAKWDRLYYCHRCGIVFDPVANVQFQPNQMYTYLRIRNYEL